MPLIEHALVGRRVFVKPADGDKGRLGWVEQVYADELLRVNFTKPGCRRLTRLHRLDELVVLPSEMPVL